MNAKTGQQNQIFLIEEMYPSPGLDWDQKTARAFLAIAAHHDYLNNMLRHATHQRIYALTVLFQTLNHSNLHGSE